MSDHQKPVRRAFVFGGGGVLGFAWIVGALTAIQHELGIEPGAGDLVVGTSAGSVIAGLLGCGVDIDTIRRHQLGMPLPEDPAITWNYDVDTGGSLPRRPGLRPGSPRLLWDGIRQPSMVSPVRIDARSYIDGGTASNASVDLVPKDEFDEVYVLAPMAALEPDSPRSPVAMVERRMRRAITKGIAGDVAVLREAGARVMLLTPGRDDLSVMGANLMNPNRRIVVLHTTMRTAAVELRNQQHGARRRVATP